MTRLKSIIYFSFLLVLTAIVSCSKWDEYKKFQNGKEVVYPQKASNIIANGGKNRVQIKFKKAPDPTIISYRVFWNNGADSMNINNLTTTDDTIRVIINSLSERSYEFDLRSIDKDGNKSIKNTVVGKSYGDFYTNSLLNRTVNDPVLAKDTVRGTMGATDSTNIITKIEYVDKGGQNITLLIPQSQTALSIPDFGNVLKLKVSSSFIPEKGALDTFWSKTAEVLVNGYVGSYLSSGVRTNYNAVADYPASPAGTSPWSFTTSLGYVSGNTCRVQSANTDGSLGYMNIRVNADNTVSILTTSETTLTNLVPWPGKTSTYDPATKTFRLYYQYTNTNGTFRTVDHTLVAQ